MQLQFSLMNSGDVDSLWTNSGMSRLESVNSSPQSSWHSWSSGWVPRVREGNGKVGELGMRN